jgi:hypothetical protein
LLDNRVEEVVRRMERGLQSKVDVPVLEKYVDALKRHLGSTTALEDLKISSSGVENVRTTSSQHMICYRSSHTL